MPQKTGFEQGQSIMARSIPGQRGLPAFAPRLCCGPRAHILGALMLSCTFFAAPSFADAGGSGAGAPAVRTARGWAAMSGSDLKATLDGWSRAAGWTLVWDSPVNYRLRASAQFGGDFETAVASLVDTIHRSNPEVLVTLYRGNRVVHVETTLVETR
jgi:hypothetical protein